MDHAANNPVSEIAQQMRGSAVAVSTIQLLDWVELARLSSTARVDEALQRACDLMIEYAGAEFCAAFAWRGRTLHLIATAHGHLARAEVSVDEIARESRGAPVAILADGIAYGAKLGRKSHGVLFVRGGTGAPDPVAVALAGFAATALARAEREQVLVQALRRARSERAALASKVTALERIGSRASHDLKAPLVAIRGYVDMVLRGMSGPIEPKTQRYLEKVNGSVDRMKQLIDSRVHPTSTRQLSDLSGLFPTKNEAVWARLGERDVALLRRTLARCSGEKSIQSTAEEITIQVTGATEKQLRTLRAIASRAGGTTSCAESTSTLTLPRALR